MMLLEHRASLASQVQDKQDDLVLVDRVGPSLKLVNEIRKVQLVTTH